MQLQTVAFGRPIAQSQTCNTQAFVILLLDPNTEMQMAVLDVEFRTSLRGHFCSRVQIHGACFSIDTYEQESKTLDDLIPVALAQAGYRQHGQEAKTRMA